MNRKERAEELERRIADEVALLEEELNQGASEGFLKLLEFQSRFHRYSLGNCLLIAIQKPDATYCAGMSTWNKMGYRVRKGESAIWVRAPLLKKVIDRETGETRERLTGYIAVPIFDISQLEGEVVVPEFSTAVDGDWEFAYHMARVNIGATGVLCDEEPLPTGIHGMSLGGRIVINPNLSSGEKLLALLHELGHEQLHWGEDRPSFSKQQKELEAESVSFLLARLYGLTNPYSRDYIISYRGTVERLHESLTRITLAVRKSIGILRLETQVAKAA